MEEKKEKKHISRYLKTVLIMTGLIIILSLPALSPHLCDMYTDKCYPLLCDTISHFTALFPFAVGEILMYAGALMLTATIIILLLLIFFHKKKRYRSFCSGYFKTFSIILLATVLIYIPTWFVPFCGTVLGQGDPDLRTEYTYDEIYALLSYIAEQANAAAEEIYISDDGSVEFYPPEKGSALAAQAMADLGTEFSRLRGYYPPVKTAICSDILNRMDIGGYNYPYTMEPTHNRYVSPLYQLALDAHEYAHHKGYYKENEACFLSYIALSKSDDPYLRLAGYYEMYDYMYFPYLEAGDSILDQMIEAGELSPIEKIETHEDFLRAVEQRDSVLGKEPELSDRVYMIFDAGIMVEEEIYDADEHVIDEMPAVNEIISDTASEGWRIQGEILQENSYNGVVLLLLQYFCSGDHPIDGIQEN